MEKYLEEIARIIEDIADIPHEEIELESSMMDDLSLSSMEIMTVISEVEHLYNIKISEKELLQIDQIDELIKCIENKTEEK